MFIKYSLILSVLFSVNLYAQKNMFEKHMDKIHELKSLIKLNEKEIKEIIDKKKRISDTTTRARLTHQLEVKRTYYETYIKEMNLIKEKLRKKFPNKLDEIKGGKKQQARDLYELEEEVDLESHMKRLQSKINKKYKPLNREAASDQKAWDKAIDKYKGKIEREKDIEFIQ